MKVTPSLVLIGAALAVAVFIDSAIVVQMPAFCAVGTGARNAGIPPATIGLALAAVACLALALERAVTTFQAGAPPLSKIESTTALAAWPGVVFSDNTGSPGRFLLPSDPVPAGFATS